jgi:hypothetical protein
MNSGYEKMDKNTKPQRAQRNTPYVQKGIIYKSNSVRIIVYHRE